ncbi:MAG: beta-L-arabinofuranosidase domain-containing protein [Mycobacteriales bacterium]
MTDQISELPLGDVRPAGWLLDQLRLQAAGQTGQLEDIWPDVGPENGWLGGAGDDWERGPYYADGLVPLAHLLQDLTLLAKADRWVEAILASQREDGWFGPPGNDDWWPRMVALKVLTQHADATGDDRVGPFLERYFRYQLEHLAERPLSGWGRARGADNVGSILWLHRRTPARWLLDLARLVLTQTDDWAHFLIHDLPAGPAPEFRHLVHGVNIAMGLKRPAMEFLVDGDESHRAELVEMLANLDRRHGLAHGTFSGDEWLGGRDPQHGVETCLVTEYLYTLEQAVAAFGDGRYADRLELVAFNLLPAACDPRMLAHQYHQQANQVLVSFAPRDWSFSGPDANVFGLEPHFGCCTANLHQGWPKFARSLWMRSGDRGLAAISYAPCTVRAKIDGATIAFEVRTSYPFDERIEIAVTEAPDAPVAWRLRVPEWASGARISLVTDGSTSPVAIDRDAAGFVTVDRVWHVGDSVLLELPMSVRTVERDRAAVAYRLGPLVLAHGIAEIWRPVPDANGLGEWEITPRKAWNLGILPEDPAAWAVVRRPVAPVPFTSAEAPVVVHARGAKILDWQLEDNSAGTPPQSPVEAAMPIERMPLVPYGCARLRITEFPTIRSTTGG